MYMLRFCPTKMVIDIEMHDFDKLPSLALRSKHVIHLAVTLICIYKAHFKAMSSVENCQVQFLLSTYCFTFIIHLK